MPAINDWLLSATTQLHDAGIASARLDAELILSHTIRKGRTYLHAHGDDPLDDRSLEIADARLVLRLDRVPVAYIIGHKDFYRRPFKVTTATLIPRPESETMISMLVDIVPNNQTLFDEPACRLVDVGTGSGCLGITAKLEYPELEVSLLDISRHALNIAEINAKRLSADVTLLRSDLLAQYPLTPHIILANLPYVDTDWPLEPELAHEPATALFADDHGLLLIKKLIDQSRARLPQNGFLLLEADTRQHAAIISYAKKHDFIVANQQELIVSLQLTHR